MPCVKMLVQLNLYRQRERLPKMCEKNIMQNRVERNDGKRRNKMKEIRVYIIDPNTEEAVESKWEQSMENFVKLAEEQGEVYSLAFFQLWINKPENQRSIQGKIIQFAIYNSEKDELQEVPLVLN